MQKALDATDYRKLREEQKAKQEAFKRGETRELMGIGVAFFTEIVGAGPSKNCDILGIAMFDSCEIRIHPTGKGIARMGTKSQGQGHETTWAQIIATEIGIPADDIAVEEGNTDTAPYGLGTYGSRSTPVAGAAIAMAARKIKAKAQMIAAYMLEVHEGDLEWDVDRFSVKGNPEAFKTMSQIAWAAYNKVPPGMEPGLEAVSYYDPPNMTYPFGAYICVMDIDVDTGVHKVRRFYALDDCGTRINPMIIEGQVHGGCTEGYAIAMGQEIVYDEDGNVKGASFMDYFLPTAVETPHWETDYTVTPSPHHPIGAKGVGESPNVGSVPCFANAVNDAFKFAGSTHIPMPHDAYRIWQAAEDLGPARPSLLPPGEGGAKRRMRALEVIGPCIPSPPLPEGEGSARMPSERIPREAIAARLAEVGYVADRDLATALWMMDYLKRPLLIEGEAGVGKTEVAKALAALHGCELIRMQCYEGLDASSALYEWNYQRQLLAIKAREGGGASASEIEAQIFSEDYLLERPLLSAIRRKTSPVLLVDEVDRADEEFEAFLLELLSDFQVTIPEFGTIMALSIPRVVLTSNATRELSDALRRRCLYHYLDFPDVDREAAILLNRQPNLDANFAFQIARMVGMLRKEDLKKVPGVAETLDWAATLAGLEVKDLHDEPEIVHATLIALLKTREDRASISPETTSRLVGQVA